MRVRDEIRLSDNELRLQKKTYRQELTGHICFAKGKPAETTTTMETKTKA